LLRVDPERRFLTPPSKAGLGAVEWVKSFQRQFYNYDRKKLGCQHRNSFHWMLLQPNTCFVLNFEAKANKIKNKQVEVKEKDKAKVKVKKPVWLRIIWIWVKT
jgi:hypothetical protein